MKLVFIHGPVASGKLTVARELAVATEFALFHNHLVVDAVSALFPFGSEPFRRLREQLWLTLLEEAARADRDTIFTFAPEPTVAPDFVERLRDTLVRNGGQIFIVELTIDPDEQERRLTALDRAAFGKMRDIELLRRLRPDMRASSAAMPPADLVIDTGSKLPREAAEQIATLIA